MNWAVYRAFVKRERRYYAHVAAKVSLLVDLYDNAGYPPQRVQPPKPFWHRKDQPPVG